MTVDAWIFLWVVLLWGSSAAFLLVTLYILGGALKGALAGKSGGDDG